MSVSLLSLPLNVIQYMATLALDPKDTSHFRATCKTIYKGVKDTAEKYRERNSIEDTTHLALYNGHLGIIKWCASQGYTIDKTIFIYSNLNCLICRLINLILQV